MLRLFPWLLIFLSAVACAETAWVTDTLRLGLHARQDTSDEPMLNLVSGAELEVLQREGNFAEVETADGDRGWVRAAYLVSEKPTRALLNETRAILTSVQAELAAEQAARLAAEQQLNRLTDAESGTGQGASLTALAAQTRDLEARLEEYRNSLPTRWVISALLVTLLAGFGLGLWVFDGFIRRRLGGFRPF